MQNNNSALNFTKKEAQALDDYFTDVNTIHGELPAQDIIEAVQFKDDDSYGNGDEYNTLFKKFGAPNAYWIAQTFCEYAYYNDRGVDLLASVLNKLIQHNYMTIDANTGIITYDTTRMSIVINDDDAEELMLIA